MYYNSLLSSIANTLSGSASAMEDKQIMQRLITAVVNQNGRADCSKTAMATGSAKHSATTSLQRQNCFGILSHQCPQASQCPQISNSRCFSWHHNDVQRSMRIDKLHYATRCSAGLVCKPYRSSILNWASKKRLNLFKKK